MLHEPRGQLRDTWMQYIDNAYIDHQSHRGVSGRFWVGLGGHRSVSTPPVMFGSVSHPLGEVLVKWLAMSESFIVCKTHRSFSTHSIPTKLFGCAPSYWERVVSVDVDKRPVNAVGTEHIRKSTSLTARF